MNLKKVLLVEDDPSLSLAIKIFLNRQKLYEVFVAHDIESAQKELETHKFDLVLTDIKMPGGSGYDLFLQIKQNTPSTIVILMTGYATVEQAIQAIKNGAFEFLVKPFKITALENVLNSAFEENENIEKQKIQLSAKTHLQENKNFITKNPNMQALIQNLQKVAKSKATILLQGESGTGKEILANMIHQFSPRHDQAFIAINCAALPDNLLESELFGHEKGSFTGAIQRQIGKFELSDKGTIFLDEISEMSLNMQTKLLRVLQEYEVYRIGGNKPIALNLRIIASTNRDLYQYMKAGHFREDLYYRINVIPIHVPPLRDRGEDIMTLSEYFLDYFSKIHQCPKIAIDSATREKLISYPWQGNVRELRNVMERTTLVGGFENVGIDFEPNHTLPQNMSSHPHAVTAAVPIDQMTQSHFQNMSLEEVSKRVILETLGKCKGNRTRAAEKLGISLRTLRNKLKSFKIQDGTENDGLDDFEESV